MKNYIRIFLGSFLMLFFAITALSQNKVNETVVVCFKSNMDCKECEATLTDYLKFEKGIKDLKVDLGSNTIKLVYKAGKNTPANLAKGIKKKGYEANLISEEEYNKLIVVKPEK